MLLDQKYSLRRDIAFGPDVEKLISFRLIERRYRPRQLCNNLLHKLSVRGRFCESPHIPKISSPESGDLGECSTQIVRETVDDFRAPSFRLLPVEDVGSDA